MSLVSIIVPVYNSEKTLARCISAILSQTFQNFELLLCNDGSSDRSLKICEDFATDDKRIKVYTLLHQGVSAARNVGLSHASGKYILFADSDDMPYPDWIAFLLFRMKEKSLAVGGYSCIDANGNRCYGSEKQDDGILDGVSIHPLQFMEDLFSNSHMYQGYLWNKIFDASLIREKQLHFDEYISYNEDRLFVFSYLLHCHAVSYSNIPVYYYYLALEPRKNYKKNYITEIDAFQIMCRELYRRRWISPCYYALTDELRAINELLPLAISADSLDFRRLNRLEKRVRQCLQAIRFYSCDEFHSYLRHYAAFQNERLPVEKELCLYQDFLRCAVRTGAEPMDYLKYEFYRLDSVNRDTYFTRRQYAEFCAMYDNASSAEYITDKILFCKTYEPFLLRKFVTARETDAVLHFSQMCQSRDFLVFKPVSGGYGQGVRIFSTHDETACDLIRDALIKGLGLVEEKIVQHEIPASFHPASINTIRSVTVISSQGCPVLIAAAIRTGTGDGQTDNGNGGGIFANINVKTGSIDRDGTSHYGFSYTRHPDTNVPFIGTSIPCWSEFQRVSLEVALVQPELRLCCWDWAITSNGKFALIEGNLTGGIGLNQAALQRGLKKEVLEGLL